MKILFCVSSMEAGGAERVASTLVNAWSARGSDVVLMPTFSGRGGCFYPISPPTQVVYLADMMQSAQVGRWASYFLRLRALRNYLRSMRPDVIVSFLPNVNVMVLAASLGLDLKVVICERTDPFEMPVVWPLRAMRALMYPIASRLVVQTEAVARKFANLWRPIPQVSVIGNPIPAVFLVDRAPILHAADRPKCLLAVGRLSVEKRFDHLIRTFAALSPRHPGWILRIVGDGPERARLEQLVIQLGVSRAVELPGRSTNIESEFIGADAFALTSRFEGFPNALLEAMASGLPCVATDCPSGPSEMSERGDSALLVPVDDALALERVLDGLLGDASLRSKLGARARRSVLQRFSLERVLKQWDEVLLS